MARKVKSTKTPQERRAEAESLHESITEQVEALRDSEAWTRFLTFAQVFHRYSIGNLLLILAQRPEATNVAGYRTWQKLDRQVRKGERGIRIFGGRDITNGDEDVDDNGQRPTVFFPVSVFDMGQTDPINDADPAELTRRLSGEDPTGIYDAVADYLTSMGWIVERAAIPGETNGYTRTDGSRQVAIDADLSPAQAAKTALHEAAHVLLHASEDPADYVGHRGIRETEAESVAYIVAGVLGLDTTPYSIGYVAEWSHGDLELIKGTAARVLRTAHVLAEELTDQHPTDKNN